MQTINIRIAPWAPARAGIIFAKQIKSNQLEKTFTRINTGITYLL